MSENQHKCKLTGMELQQEYLKTQGYDSRITPEGYVEVYVNSENIPEFKVTVPFKYFAEWGNIYWNALKEYPIDITQCTFDNFKEFDVVLYTGEGFLATWWSNVKTDQLEETILQAVVTHYNINKHKEEQT